MKNSLFTPVSGRAIAVRPLAPGCFAALLAGLLSVSWPVAVSRAQPSRDDEQGGQVLTRGPVHEAFAGVVSYNPEPGIVVSVAPPDLIEELPPEERPEGDDVTWISGYWAWDDERNDYLWISGTWRALPPGREWMAGYWRDTGRGHQWISGYWADANVRETTYQSAPPVTLEIGANLESPSPDYGWTPGCWVWYRDRYAWRAGYWAEGRSDWVWIPAYYVWTPRGVIFVEGFWDYPVRRRGLLFAPVYYQSREYARRGYSYSPRIVISLSFFDDNLFLRPSYHHYYFGDYYGSRYEQEGFYASFSFQTSRSGYDPFYSYNRWEHRSDRDWENRYQATWRHRRDNETARPPRTWAAQLSINTTVVVAGQTRIMAAAPIEQVARSRDNPVRFQSVPQGDRQKFGQRGREIQQSRESRRTVEARAAVATGRNAVEPVKVALPKSPIVARPAGQRGGNQAPPAVQKAPQPDPQVQARAEAPGRQQGANGRNPAETRQPGRNAPADGRATEQAREETQRKAQQDAGKNSRDATARSQSEERAQQQAEKRANDSAEKARADSERKAQQAEERANAAVVKSQQDAQQRDQRAQQQAEDRANVAAAKARDESQRKAEQAEQKANASAEKARQAEERGKADRAREESQQRANEAAAKSQRDAEERGKAARAQEDSQRKVQEQKQAEERGKASAAKAQESAPRKEQPVQPEAEKRGKEPAAKVKPATSDKTPEEVEEEAKKERGKPSKR